MTETEFDKYVKDLLYNAQEEVSPRVWEGVAAGLPARRRVVPFWGWAATVAASAAAVVAAVILLHTAPSSAVSPSTSALTAPVAAVYTPVEVYELPMAPERKQPQPVEQRIAVREEAIPSVSLLSGRVEAAAPGALRQRKMQAAGEEDARLMDLLAFSEDHPQLSGRGLSLVADGSLQGNQRGNIGSGSFRRPFSAPPVGAGEGIYNETPETSFMLPFSVGLGVRYNFTSRWAVGTGIRYTNLSRTFVADFVSRDGIIVPQTDIDNHQHWFGIPVNLYYDIVNTGRWRVHAFAGGAAELLMANSFLIHYSPKDLHYERKGTVPQWSVAAGLGVEFRVTSRVGLYIDPHFRYYFDAGQQPRSLRTIQPLRFDIEGGIRFSFGRQ